MRKFLSLAAMCTLAFPAMAFAQEPEAPAEVEAVVEEAPAEEAPVVPAEEAMPEPPKMAADDIGAEYAPESPEEGQKPFLDGLSWQLMASAFYFFNGYRVSGDYNDIVPPPGEDNRAAYPYTSYMGFGLNFAGGDVMYTGEKFAVRLDLRFGTAAPRLSPLAPIKQGYVAWLPHERVSIDFGFFDTPFGAEVVDEWNNANYTRGALYFLRQPFNHLGVRMGAELTDILGLTFLVTNGGVLGATPIDTKQAPAIGWQLGLTPDGHRSVRRRGLREGDREVGIFLGGNHAPNGANENKDWESFFDMVLSLNFDWFTLKLNGDYQVNPHGVNPETGAAEQMIFQYGHSLALIFDATDKFGIGLRGEHLGGNDNYRDFGDPDNTFGFLWTGTLTFRYKPVEYLVLSLEGRVEGAGENIYFTRNSPTVNDVVEPDEKIFGAVIIGATAHIGN